MDPEEALKNARKALAEYRGADSSRDTDGPASDLADAFEALDEWLSRGGYLPIAWSKVDSKLAQRSTV